MSDVREELLFASVLGFSLWGEMGLLLHRLLEPLVSLQSLVLQYKNRIVFGCPVERPSSSSERGRQMEGCLMAPL